MQVIYRAMKHLTALLLAFLCTAALAQPWPAPPRQVKVADNGRFLVNEQGKPFFYLGDTAWELFHRLNREEADLYLETRARQGFTVIQAVALAELDGLDAPNPYGELPLIDKDPARPNEKYFEHVDYIVNKAAAVGLVTGMLPTWGDKVNKKWGKGPEIFNLDNARAYGKWIGNRYKDKPIIWILGGDRPLDKEEHKLTYRAMAEGIREAVGNTQLITYHIQGGMTTGDFLHNEKWLDFNMMQSGHGKRHLPNYQTIAKDYARQPVKPCMDSEPCYENHPIDWKAANGWFDEHDVRKAAYWALFAGAQGHTYGCHDIWQMYVPGRHQPISAARTWWKQALHFPAAYQMKTVRTLLESRSYLTRIPDQSLLEDDYGNTPDHCQATRCSTGAWAMVYIPTGKTVTVDLDKLAGDKLTASWVIPRSGEVKVIGPIERKGKKQFKPPMAGEREDWVLVLE